jgi:hypothetical protein
MQALPNIAVLNTTRVDKDILQDLLRLLNIWKKTYLVVSLKKITIINIVNADIFLNNLYKIIIVYSMGAIPNTQIITLREEFWTLYHFTLSTMHGQQHITLYTCCLILALIPL